MKNILLSIILVIFSNSCFSQNKLTLRLIDKVPDYISITEVLVSPPVFYENIMDEYNAGHKYRVITTLSGIYGAVYIDRVSLNVEGGVNKQDWSRKIELRKLYEEYSLSEETDNVGMLNWMDNCSFTFELSGLKFAAFIMEEGSIIQVTRLNDD